MNLLTATGLVKAFTDRTLLDQVDFSVNEGDKVGVIGINGTGKSTLLRILAGLEDADEGVISKGNKVYVQYLAQNPDFPPNMTVFDYVITENKTSDNEWEIEGDAKNMLQKLGLTDLNQTIDLLSGGQKKRVALAAGLLKSCDILILDEPTNHLDSEMTRWLENYLIQKRCAIVMVTHDRYFLDRVCNRIIEIDQKKIYGYSTNYEGFLEAKVARELMELASERKRQTILRSELEWLHRGARARSTKQKAHIGRIESLMEEKGPTQKETIQMSSVKSRMGRTTIELDSISKGYQKKLIQDFTYIFLPTDRIGIIGPNGCGKTTLIKLITNNLEPDTGKIITGETIKTGYFSQENEYMNEEQKVIDYMKDTAEFLETTEGLISASKMLERFLFDSTLQYQQIKRLSGGEKRRLYLLKVLMEAPNVLILDEPTNDLDIQTLSILEDYIEQFQGIVITVSHDRYFLDRIVNRLFVFEQNGFIRQVEGSYSDYLMTKVGESELESQKINEKNGEDKKQKPKTVKLKLTFLEQKEWDTIEQDIESLEQQIAQLDGEMLQYGSDFAKLSKLSKEKEDKEEQLMCKMERWEYLSELVEKIEQEQKK